MGYHSLVTPTYMSIYGYSQPGDVIVTYLKIVNHLAVDCCILTILRGKGT